MFTQIDNRAIQTKSRNSEEVELDLIKFNCIKSIIIENKETNLCNKENTTHTTKYNKRKATEITIDVNLLKSNINSSINIDSKISISNIEQSDSSHLSAGTTSSEESEQEIEKRTNSIVDRYKLLLSCGKKLKNTPAFRKAMNVALKSDNSGVSRLNFDTDNELVVSTQNNKMSIFHVSSQNLLGEGAFGRVVEGRNVDTGEKIAFKTAKIGNSNLSIQQYINFMESPTHDEREEYDTQNNPQVPMDDLNAMQKAIDQIQNGVDILTKLNENGSQRGVPKMALVHALGLYGMNLAVCTLDDYNLDIHPKINFNSIFLDLAEGIKYFYIRKCIQNDIKPSNIHFYMENDRIVARHADTDGGIWCSQISRKRVRAPHFTLFPQGDLDLLKKIVNSDVIDYDAVMDIHMKQMVYCLGRTMQPLSKTLNTFQHSFIIEQMVDPDMEKRPHINTVCSILQFEELAATKKN